MIVLLSAEPIEVGEEWEPRSVLGATTTQIAPNVAVSEGRQTAKPEAGPMVEIDEEEEDESFAELDRIKTDVDIDAILREQPGESSKSKKEPDPS